MDKKLKSVLFVFCDSGTSVLAADHKRHPSRTAAMTAFKASEKESQKDMMEKVLKGH